MANKNFKVKNGLETDGALTINGSTSGAVAISAPAVAGTQSYTLPTAYPASNGYVLSSTTSGTLSWASSGGGGGGTPGGSDTQVQFNDSGAFGGSANMTWDGSVFKATNLESTNTSGDEGGEIKLNKATTNTTLTTGVTIDVYQNKLRFFETGGSNRGTFIDLTKAADGVASNLLAPIPAVKSESLSGQPWSTLPGCLYVSSIGNSLTIAAQTVRYQPFYVTAPITLTELAIQVSTATSLASCNAMIFIASVNLSSTGWQPTSNLSGGYAGEITSITTTGIKSITGLSISLPAGAYLMAVQFSNYTGTLQCRSIPNQVITGNGYCFSTSDGTTYAMNRTGVSYSSGTPATAANWTNGSYGNIGHPGVVWAKWTVN